MRASASHAVVRSISGRPELRHRVMQVREWRIERTVDAAGFVLSVTGADGASQSFFVDATDAGDIGEVLRREAACVDAGTAAIEEQ
ncbi:hypothetical protein [uncultured Variovorax sp.]|uniref:hypothetical protein n=1 Tax=uncultured Variovorax sp. TaxID=114708 RepID=UPI0025E2DFDE|nr:hypothetical protein [uncultured Variovorax sp.]